MPNIIENVAIHDPMHGQKPQRIIRRTSSSSSPASKFESNIFASGSSIAAHPMLEPSETKNDPKRSFSFVLNIFFAKIDPVAWDLHLKRVSWLRKCITGEHQRIGEKQRREANHAIKPERIMGGRVMFHIVLKAVFSHFNARNETTKTTAREIQR